MVVNYYSVKDLKSGEYGNVFPSANNETAKREFLTAIQDERTMMHKYPQDFELYYLFAIDSVSGKVVNNVSSFIANAVIAMKKEEDEDAE